MSQPLPAPPNPQPADFAAPLNAAPGRPPARPLADHVPLLDVARENGPLRAELLEAIARVVDSGQFVHGPDCQRLEQSLAGLCQVRHAVGCASGSDALLLSLMALDIGPGDAVIVPSFTFFATASAAWRLGARLVFADIDPLTFNLDPQALAAAVTSNTRAVIAVHLYGQCAAMEPIAAVSERSGAALIEDAAQSIGATYRERPAGNWGSLGCFSFYPTKNLGGFGDGGLVTTDSDLLAARLRLLASHGMQPRYHHGVVGINSRLDSLQAATLNVKLARLADATAARGANAQRYQQMFAASGLDQILQLPATASHCRHVWNQFTIRVPDGRRDALRAHLRQRGVATEVYYPVPLHLQECFRPLGYRPGSLPHTEQAAREVLSLPIFPRLREAEQAKVVAEIRAFF